MLLTPQGTRIYTRQEAIDAGEEDPGEGHELLVFTVHEDGTPLFMATCIAGTYQDGTEGD